MVLGCWGGSVLGGVGGAPIYSSALFLVDFILQALQQLWLPASLWKKSTTPNTITV